MKSYNITDFGARTCELLQTKYIQNTIDECFKNGGGEVVIPKGVFRTATIRLRSNVTLHLLNGAILEGSRNPDDYFCYLDDKIEPISEKYVNTKASNSAPLSRWNNALIRAFDAENISIIGDEFSYIDGMNCFDPIGEEKYRGPHIITMYNCKNLNFYGYTIKNSSNWAHNIVNSKDIYVHNITVLGGHDGFDARTCDNILIENCEFRTGDDCIAGFDNIDVTIRNCILDSSCSALRFGGTNVLIDNCKGISPASFAHRYTLPILKQAGGLPGDENSRYNMLTGFLYYCDFRAEIRETPGNILIQNCEFENPDKLFELNFGVLWCENRSLSSIKFKNCKITDISQPILIFGDKNEPITFELEDVEISAKEGFEDIPVIQAKHFDKIIFKNVVLSNFKNPTFEKFSDGEFITEASTELSIKQIQE